LGEEDLIVEIGRKKYIIKKDRRYTETDEWALLSGNIVIMGITDYAQKELKDIVGVELPEKNKRVKKGEELGVIESVKATSEYYAPVSGEIIEVNEKLLEEPELLNIDPYGEGWIVKIKPENIDEYNTLLTPEQYAEHIKSKEKS
jgi:glycine cleavage system H protein